MKGYVQVVPEEWNDVFMKCWHSVKRCSRSVGRVEQRVQEVLGE